MSTGPANTARRAQGIERRLEHVAATVKRDPAAVTPRVAEIVASLAAMLDRISQRGGAR